MNYQQKSFPSGFFQYKANRFSLYCTSSEEKILVLKFISPVFLLSGILRFAY